MKKERHIDSQIKTPIITIVITGFLIFICLLSLTDKLSPKFQSNAHSIIFAVVITIILLPSLFFFFGNLWQILQYYYTKYHRHHSYLRDTQRVNRSLGKNFSVIKIKNWDNQVMAELIPEDSVICTAKRDEKGNVIYRIYVEAEMSTKDYAWFLHNFKI